MIGRVLADRYEISDRAAWRQPYNWAEMPDDPAGPGPANSTTPYPWKRILPVDGPERERELFPDRGWVHLTPPRIATAPRLLISCIIFN
ncbi:MAG: hypothetical protein GDA56_07545 [Hormoscilla sp. GM7CHS1pb]|nr:hypothetical protein [Hormoscilla sp. GM7CHS1pb]